MTAWLSFVHVGAELHHLGSASPTVSLRLIKLNELILLDFQNLNEKKKQKPVCVLNKCLIESKDDSLLISAYVWIIKYVPTCAGISGATFPRAVSERKYAIP